MDAKEINPIPSDVMADLEAVCLQAAGAVPDPELVRRVRERAERARREVLDRLGVQDVGVAIIRATRDEVRHQECVRGPQGPRVLIAQAFRPGG